MSTKILVRPPMMNERTKKIILGVGILALAGLFAFILWYLFLKPVAPVTVPPTPIPETPTDRPRTGLPTARPGTPGTAPLPGEETTPIDGTGTPRPEATISPVARGGRTAITTLTTQRVTTPQLVTDGRGLAYYSADDGKFYRVSRDGAVTPLSDRVFRDVENITWAPNAGQAILEFPDGANILYDFERERQVTLPIHWTGFDFAATGDAIAFKSIGSDPTDRWLAIADPDGSNATFVEEIGRNADRVTVDWSPGGQIVGYYIESRDGARQELYFIGQHHENFNLATLEGRQFNGQWTPDGSRLLYSVYSGASDLKPSLWLVDGAPGSTGENRQPLNIQTWADKCAFGDANTAYCAVPRSLPRGAGIVREAAQDAADDFYRVDLRTGTSALVAIPADRDVNAQNLAVSDDGANLFFTDERTGTLERIRLE